MTAPICPCGHAVSKHVTRGEVIEGCDLCGCSLDAGQALLASEIDANVDACLKLRAERDRYRAALEKTLEWDRSGHHSVSNKLAAIVSLCREALS